MRVQGHHGIHQPEEFGKIPLGEDVPADVLDGQEPDRVRRHVIEAQGGNPQGLGWRQEHGALRHTELGARKRFPVQWGNHTDQHDAGQEESDRGDPDRLEKRVRDHLKSLRWKIPMANRSNIRM